MMTSAPIKQESLLPALVWVLALIVFLGILPGCFSVLREERREENQHEARLLATTPIHNPRLTVLPHNDGLGWTVRATHEVERRLELRTSQQRVGRRYVFSPLSVFAGLIQCPFGLLSIFNTSPSGNETRYGCHRLLMLEPLQGAVELPPVVSSDVKTERHQAPLVDGAIQLSWPGLSSPVRTYPLGRTGEVGVRLSHLLTMLRTSSITPPLDKHARLLIRLRYGDGSVEEQAVSVSSHHLQLALNQVAHPIDKHRWPVPLILQIHVDQKNMPPAKMPLVRDRLTSWALQQGLCVVATDAMRQHVIEEQQTQYAGAVSDHQQVPLGRMLPPSAVLTAHENWHGSTPYVTLRISTLRNGEHLASVSSRDLAGLALDTLYAVLPEMELLMAHAPKTGCPVQKLS